MTTAAPSSAGWAGPGWALPALWLALACATSCGGSQVGAADPRAEARARRASERVTGPDGRPAAGFAHYRPLGVATKARSPEATSRHADDGEDAPSGGPATRAGRPEDPPPASEAGPTGPDDGRKYPIVLSPPSVVGERTWERIEATVRTELTIRVDGNEVRRGQEDRTVRLVGLSVVEEIDATGIPLVYRVAIDTATVEAGGQTRDLAPRGASLEVRRKGPKPRLLLGGQPVAEADVGAWEAVISTSDPGASNDAVFGSREPRAVGERWSIDAPLCASDLSRAGQMSIAAGDVRGESTLLRAAACGPGKTCLHIRTDIEIASFGIPKLPAGASLRGAEARVRLDLVQPVAHRSAASRGAMDMQVAWTVAMQRDGRDIEVETRMHTVQRGESEPR